MLGVSLGSTDGKALVSYEGTKLVSTDGKVFGTILGNVYGITFGINIGTERVCLNGSLDRSNYGKLGGYCL